MTGLPSLSAAKIDNVIELTYRGVDSNSLDTNGFGGDSFTLTDKAVSPVSVYDQYLNPFKGEFLLFRDNAGFGSRTFSTIGLDNTGGLCLFAVGLRNDPLPTSRVADYSLLGDGVGRIGGQALRPFGSTGILRLDTAARTATIEFKLTGRSDPFGNFLSQTSSELTVLTATMPLQANSFQGSLTGTNGFNGSIEGQLVGPVASNSIGGGGAGAVFTFQVSNARADLLFGAIAGEQL